MKKEELLLRSDWSVVIPYSDLLELVDCARNARKLTEEYSRVNEQLSKIREIQIEIMDKIGEIERYM